ncbi:MAG: zinc-binding dehydrogenase [Halobacteriaceae archaeon]
MSNPTVVFPEAREVRVEDRDVPDPGPGEFLVETTRTLVSTGTELTILSGDYPEGSNWDSYGEYPFDAGYCNVGEVVATGEGVDPDLVGTRVASRSSHAAYHTVAEDGLWVPVPEAVDDEEAAFFAIAGIVMNGVRRGEVSWGDDVAVYGLGLLGQFAVRFCQHAGARTVVGFDLADSRLEYLPDLPAVVGANPREEAPTDVVDEAAGRDADVVFEVTGSPAAIPDQFDVLREAGRFVVLSSPRGETPFDFHDLCNGPGYEIVGAHEMTHAPERVAGWGYDDAAWTHRRHYEYFFELLAEGRVDVEPLVSHRVPGEDAPALYEDLLEDRTDALGVVLEW